MTVKKLETANFLHFSSTNDFNELKQNKTESLLCWVGCSLKQSSTLQMFLFCCIEWCYKIHQTSENAPGFTERSLSSRPRRDNSNTPLNSMQSIILEEMCLYLSASLSCSLYQLTDWIRPHCRQLAVTSYQTSLMKKTGCTVFLCLALVVLSRCPAGWVWALSLSAFPAVFSSQTALFSATWLHFSIPFYSLWLTLSYEAPPTLYEHLRRLLWRHFLPDLGWWKSGTTYLLNNSKLCAHVQHITRSCGQRYLRPGLEIHHLSVTCNIFNLCFNCRLYMLLTDCIIFRLLI